jgi:carboxylate-amine ligase
VARGSLGPERQADRLRQAGRAGGADLIRELIEWFLDDVLDELGTRKEVEYAFKILAEGSSAQRQLATYARTGDLKAVVDQLIRETAEGVCEPTLGPPLEVLQAQSVPMSTASARGQSVP